MNFGVSNLTLNNNFNSNTLNSINNTNNFNNKILTGSDSKNQSPNKNLSNNNAINNKYKKQKSRTLLNSNSNSLNLKNNYLKDRDSKSKYNAEDYLNTSEIINKLFASKKDSIDFSMNSIKIERDFTSGNANSINNLDYVNKGKKPATASSTKHQKVYDYQSNKVNNNSQKDSNIPQSNPISNLNLNLLSEITSKEKNIASANTALTNKNINNNQNSKILNKNLSSGIIKKQKNADFLISDIEKNNDKDDIKNSITPYTSVFNTKLIGSSTANNIKYPKYNKKEKSKIDTNLVNTQQPLIGLKSENSFSPTYKLRKEFTDYPFDKQRKLNTNTQDQEFLRREPSTSRNKSTSKEKKAFLNRKNLLSKQNKEKEFSNQNKNKISKESNLNQNHDNNINNNKNLIKNFLHDIRNSKKIENKRISKNEDKNNEKHVNSQTANSNPFTLSSNTNNNNIKQQTSAKEKSNNKIIDKNKNKTVMIDLITNNEENIISKGIANNELEPQRESTNLGQMNYNITNKERISNFNNSNKAKMQNYASDSMNNQINKDQFLLKCENKNSLSKKEKEIIKTQSKIIENATSSLLNINPNNNLLLQNSNTQNIDLTNEDNNNPELNIYKSNKIKKVVKKVSNNFQNSSNTNKNNIDTDKIKSRNLNNNNDCRNKEEREIINIKSSSEEKENSRYGFKNILSEKAMEEKINFHSNSKKNKLLEKNYDENKKIQDSNNKNDLFNFNEDSSRNNKSDLKLNSYINSNNNQNYQKLKENSIKNADSNLSKQNLDSPLSKFNLRQSGESITDNFNNNYNKSKKNFEQDSDRNFKKNHSKKHSLIDNNYKFNTKTILDLQSNFNKFEIFENNRCNIIENNINNFEKGSSQLSIERRTSKRLSEAREKRFSHRFSNENYNVYLENNSTEKNSDIKKLNQKLNDVCNNLALFRLKSDSLRNSGNMENNQIKTHFRKESSDFEHNFRINLINTENAKSENNNLINNFAFNKAERMNVLRSSDPITYSNIINLDSKLVKQAILSHRYLLSLKKFINFFK